MAMMVIPTNLRIFVKKQFDMEIRKATIDDAAAIARNVMAAIGYDVFAENNERRRMVP